ncbi:MAG: hypothetical protein LBB74_03330 [Chitinispirillales bacterium]|jgi:hypothetical protein|nr:hypothetical protein [Chitinispirillales bacterium]
MASRIGLKILTIVCAFGVWGLAYAQDDVDNIDESSEELINSANDVGIDGVNSGDVADIAGKPKKSSRSGKSKKSDKPSETEELSTSPPPEKSSGNAVKVKGLVAAGVDINRKISGKSGTVTVDRNRVGKGELEFSVQPVKKVRAEIGIEYNINGRVPITDSLWRLTVTPDSDIGTSYVTDAGLVNKTVLGPYVTIDKLYGQYNIVSNGAVRAGIMKKSFGHEERAGLDERYFLKRSIVSDGLDELGFLNHDLTFSYRHDLSNDQLRLTGAFSWPVADSLTYLQNYSAQYKMNGNMEFILAGVVKHYADSANPSTTFAASLSFRHDAALVSEAELTAGTNPLIWALNYRKTTLFGARLQERFPIDINSKTLRRVIPAVEAAVYTADADSGHVDTQIRAGVALCFAKNNAFQFRNNFGTVIRTADGGSKARRYRFDSEVLVVF